MPAARPFKKWILRPVIAPGRRGSYAWEPPQPTPLLERLRRDAELVSVGRARFTGTLAQRNRLWLTYRNFLRQGLSNYKAALGVENRSASLLYYYAMLNFAKAELLRVQPAAVQGFIAHGLQFNGFKVQTVVADYLTVKDGVFRLLYEKRTGYSLPVGTRLPVKRLLRNIPEIGEQLEALRVGESTAAGVLQVIATDDSQVWALIAVTEDSGVAESDVTGRYFRKVFRAVDAPPNWRDTFGVSRRWMGMEFYETRNTFPYGGASPSLNDAVTLAAAETWRIKDILGGTSTSMWDARLSPSLYKSKMLPMPPALARYAMSFYASSLVRNKPAMLDTQLYPEQAYLFDSLARECASPMLVDTLAGLTDEVLIFLAEDAMRL
jgi:hypothetical protein